MLFPQYVYPLSIHCMPDCFYSFTGMNFNIMQTASSCNNIFCHFGTICRLGSALPSSRTNQRIPNGFVGIKTRHNDQHEEFMLEKKTKGSVMAGAWPVLHWCGVKTQSLQLFVSLVMVTVRVRRWNRRREGNQKNSSSSLQVFLWDILGSHLLYHSSSKQKKIWL